MLEVMQFIFSSFWIWLGAFIMLGVTLRSFRKILKKIFKSKKTKAKTDQC